MSANKMKEKNINLSLFSKLNQRVKVFRVENNHRDSRSECFLGENADERANDRACP